MSSLCDPVCRSDDHQEYMQMTRNFLTMFVLAAGTAAFAQAPPPPQTPPPGQTPPPAQQPSRDTKPSTVTVTGCVAEGSSGSFVLNNAMMSNAMKKEGTSGTTPPSTPSTSSTTYTLVGGENLKAHVGHKVEVTGTPGAASSATATAGAAGATASSASKAQELRVQSVKMVSATCP